VLRRSSCAVASSGAAALFAMGPQAAPNPGLLRRPVALGPRAAAILAFVAVAGLAGRASAAGGSGEPNTAPPPESDIDPESGKVRPAAPDERTGHVYTGFGASANGPVGSLGPNTPTQNLAGVGYTLGGFLGVGVGRYGTVQLLGDFTHFSAPLGCSVACSGRSFSLGLGVTYHLVQGLAFDPWGSFGMAYRNSLFGVQAPAAVTIDGQSYKAGTLAPQSYQGLDVARLALGGDWYPTSWFGFGPFLEVDIGTNLHRPAPLVPLPPNVTEGPRTYGFFQIGLRIAFDPMRRPAPPRAQAAGVDPSPRF
jgi:hypothetical protein